MLESSLAGQTGKPRRRNETDRSTSSLENLPHVCNDHSSHPDSAWEYYCHDRSTLFRRALFRC